MSRSVEELEHDIDQLSAADKYRLARRLLTDADGDMESDTDDAWLKTIKRRRQALIDGTTQTRPAKDVLTDAYSRLRDER